MKAGLSSLTWIKSQILPDNAANSAKWDNKLLRIAQGVARQFDSYCGRKFERVEGFAEDFDGFGKSYNLSRYPVETVTGIQLLTEHGDPQDNMDSHKVTLPTAGIVRLFCRLGYPNDLVTITYTGGYWVDDEEPGNDLPTGAAPVPPDLLNAFVMQCAEQVKAEEAVGAAALRFDAAETGQPETAAHELTPAVKQILDTYRGA